MAKIELNPLTSGYNINQVNVNFEAIEQEFKNKVVYRDEASPMGKELDLNGFKIINVAEGDSVKDAATLGQVQAIVRDASGLVATFRHTATATAGQTVVNTSFEYKPSGNNLRVYVNGLLTNPGIDYEETSTTTVTFLTPLEAGDEVVFIIGDLVSQVDVDPMIRSELAATSGAGTIGYMSEGAGTVATTVQDKLREFVSVKDFGAIGDGVVDDTSSVQKAVTHCFTTGDTLYWPDGTYLTTASISNLHAVRHIGPGVIQRGADLWAITPDRTTTRKLYVSPSGNDTNDGLSSAQPMAKIQTVVDRVNVYGPIRGRQQIIGAGGIYAERVSVPTGLALNNNYLEFKFPSDPGVRGDPSAWPAGGAILEGASFSGSSGPGFTVGGYNNVYVEYLLVKGWYDSGLPATSQVKNGIEVDAFANLYTFGVSAIGNGWCNLAVNPSGKATVTGGILDGARYGLNNTGGRLSLSASVSTYTTVQNALEYGLYAKHECSSVLDFTEFVNCGQVTGAEDYGAAVFAYKSGASIDTKQCNFKRNNVCYNARGGYISTSIPNTDVYGTGPDSNDRLWKVNGFGQNDLINYRARAGREVSFSFGGNFTSSTSTVLIFDSNARIPPGYFQKQEQQIEIEIFGNVVTGTGQIRPSFVGNGGTGTRYELANFTAPVNSPFYIKMIVQPDTGGASVSTWWFANGANIGGATVGRVDTISIPFSTEEMEFQVWGEVSAGSLAIRKTRVVLWG